MKGLSASADNHIKPQYRFLSPNLNARQKKKKKGVRKDGEERSREEDKEREVGEVGEVEEVVEVGY